ELQLVVESDALTNYPVVDFFPLPEGNLVVGHPHIERGPGKTTFRVSIETEDARLASLNGIVVFGQDPNGPSRNAWSLNRKGRAWLSNASSMWKFLLFVFLGGFILNLFPCFLPVISITFFWFFF